MEEKTTTDNNAAGDEPVAEAEEHAGSAEHSAKAVLVTDRDRHLCALLAEARWLTTEQLARLSFLGRAANAYRRRLRELARPAVGGWRPLLRRAQWVTSEGIRHVWGLTEDGAWTAAMVLDEELRAPRSEFEPATMAHHVALSELYVGLLEARLRAAIGGMPSKTSTAERRRLLAGIYAKAQHPAWRWKVAGDDMALPWRQYEGGASKDRLIKPDALLELVSERRRLFIECETGSHSIRAQSADKRGATDAKLHRYEGYVTGLADASAKRTWYQARFPDGYTPELVFLVPSVRRAANVNKLVEHWRRERGGPPRIKARALTLAQALSELLPVTGQAPSPPAGVSSLKRPTHTPLGLDEVEALARFFVSARRDLKRRQALAQAEGAPLPSVPDEYQRVKGIIARLQAAGGVAW